jgi:hypothetical protein
MSAKRSRIRRNLIRNANAGIEFMHANTIARYVEARRIKIASALRSGRQVLLRQKVAHTIRGRVLVFADDRRNIAGRTRAYRYQVEAWGLQAD